MDSRNYDFPFNIMDVAALLGLRIRRRQTDSVYTDCPFCGDARGKMNINHVKNTFRCNYCGEYGGMIALYARVCGVGSSDAYREICGALNTPGQAPEKTMGAAVETPPLVPSADLAGADDIHQTLSTLLGMLELSVPHRENLRNRGLTDGQIDELGYKSTPSYDHCRPLTERLIKQGCMVAGVPGFYVDKSGNWTVRFHTKTAGIFIPVKGIDGLIRGAQIRLDVPIKDDCSDKDKEGTKYLWFSSAGKRMGVSSGSPVHFVGGQFSKTVYVTEGILKADVAHFLMNRTFLAIAGANNTGALSPIFALLSKNGTDLVVEAHDMDKYRNEMVEKGAARIYIAAREHGIQTRRLTWNPNYKGIDDWQLALKMKKKQETDGGSKPPHEERKTQRFRIYQLDFSQEGIVKPWAFSGIAALYAAGYRQPPAKDYRLVHDAEVMCDADLPETGVLERIFSLYNGTLPDDYHGRSVSPSDVIELYDSGSRKYYYCDKESFVPVLFSPMLALPMKTSI